MKLFACLACLACLLAVACGGKSSSTQTTPKDTQGIGKGAMGGASYAKAGSAAPAPMPANPCEGK